MSPEQQMVQEFHAKYNLPRAARPTMPGIKDRMRRARLIVGEAAEFLGVGPTYLSKMTAGKEE